MIVPAPYEAVSGDIEVYTPELVIGHVTTLPMTRSQVEKERKRERSPAPFGFGAVTKP